MTEAQISLQKVFLAQQAIRPFCLRTPIVKSPRLSERTGANILLKLETLQPTGAFKVRGAANKIMNLSAAERDRGVITVSTGNHGRAVSYVARQMRMQAVVCMSAEVPANKVDAIRALGSEVVIHGRSQDDAFVKMAELQESCGQTVIQPFDDADIIAGQGTIGLELMEDVPSLDVALVPLSGGGLISGVALALKSIHPAVQVIGVSMTHAPVMYHSLQAGKPVQLAEEETLADSLRGGIGLENRYTFPMVRDLVDEVVLVTEEEIARAMAFVLQEHQLVVEGAGAVGIAALLSDKVHAHRKNVAVVISGCNVEIPFFIKTVQPYLHPVVPAAIG